MKSSIVTFALVLSLFAPSVSLAQERGPVSLFFCRLFSVVTWSKCSNVVVPSATSPVASSTNQTSIIVMGRSATDKVLAPTRPAVVPAPAVSGPYVTKADTQAMIKASIEGLAKEVPAVNSAGAIVYKSPSSQNDVNAVLVSKGVEGLRLSIYNHLISKFASINNLVADNITATSVKAFDLLVKPSSNIAGFKLEQFANTDGWSFLADSDNGYFHIQRVGGSGGTPFTITENGSVGIGTQAPQRKLAVAGGVTIDQDDAGSGGLEQGLVFGYNSGEGIVSNRQDGYSNKYGMDFYTNNRKTMSLTGGGNVGIGTETPGVTLDVVGTVRSNQFLGPTFGGGNDNSYPVPAVTATGTVTFIGNPVDGETVSFNNATQAYTFEFDDNGTTTSPANIAVAIGAGTGDTLSALSIALGLSGAGFTIDEYLVDGYVILTSPAIGADGNQPMVTDSQVIVLDGFSNGVNEYFLPYNGYIFGESNTIDTFDTFVVGMSNTVAGTSSVVVGNGNTVSNATLTGYAFGRNNSIGGNDGFAFGLANNVSAGSAFGNFNVSSASEGFTFGKGNTLVADRTYAFGLNNNMNAGAVESYAFGQANTMTSNNSLAFGLFNDLSGGDSAFALGYSNTLTASGTMAFGNGNHVNGLNSIAIGKSLTISDPDVMQLGMSDGAKVTIDSTGKLSTVGSIQSAELLGGVTTLSVDVDGNIIRTPSDASLKENVRSLSSTDSLGKMLRLRGVAYEWKDKTRFGSSSDIGFIAQEVEVVVPEVVKSGGSYRSLNYGSLVALVVEAVRELSSKIDFLMSSHSEYVNRVTTKELCLDDVCINRDQLLQLINRAGSSYSTPTVATAPDVTASTSAVTASSSADSASVPSETASTTPEVHADVPVEVQAVTVVEAPVAEQNPAVEPESTVEVPVTAGE